MVLFNHATREMTAKIVYYGPGLCGKTTNLLVIYDNLDARSRGKMLSLATRSDRTLFFDLLPVDLGKVGNFRLKIQLYTVPGQVFYNETRKLVLRGADAVVFVVDSQPSMLESNRDSFANLLENLKENRIDVEELPIIIQYNKRDIPGVLAVRTLEKSLGFDDYPSLEASALKGDGVMETFRLVSKVTAKKLMDAMERRPTEPVADVEPAEPEASSAPASEPSKNPADIAPAGAGLESLHPAVDHPPFDEDYDGMEEVSLEQLLEGRDRPASLGAAAPAPVQDDEDVDELTDADLIEAPATEKTSDDAEAGQPAAAEPEPEEESGTDEETSDEEDASRPDDEADIDVRAEIQALREELNQVRSDYERLADSVRTVASELLRIVDKK